MIHEKLKIALVTTSMGMITSLSSENHLTTGLALIESVSDSHIRLFTYLENVTAAAMGVKHNMVLTIQDADAPMFIAINGVAKVVDDADLVNKLWDEQKENWFAVKPTDRHVFLINLEVVETFEWKDDN